MTPWAVAFQASLSMGILQARILERVAIFFFRGSSLPKDQTPVSCISFTGRILHHFATWEAIVDPLEMFKKHSWT